MTLNKPVIVKDLKKFKKNNHIWKIHDIYESQLNELFEVTYPHLVHGSSFEKRRSEFVNKKKNDSNWVYFPWSGQLIHTVNEQDYYMLRTNRNRNLITIEEQKKLKDFTVGVVGLSVGGNIAVGLTYQGIGNSMKLADFDSLKTTNLNRVKVGIHQVGLPKTDLIAQQVYEINPYANLKLFRDGLKKATLKKYFYQYPKPQVVFDEIDDFEMKIRIRLEAKTARVPVMMMTNLGDSVLIDIERYDVDNNLTIFNGLLGDLPKKILDNPITEEDKTKYAKQIVGLEHIPIRALESLSEINKTLVGRPQLASTVIVSSGLATYLVRLLVLGHKLPSGRYYISFDKIMGLDNL